MNRLLKFFIILAACFSFSMADEAKYLPGLPGNYVISPNGEVFIYIDEKEGTISKYSNGRLENFDMSEIGYSRDISTQFYVEISSNSKFMALQYYESEESPVVAIVDINEFKVVKKINAGNFYWMKSGDLVLFGVFEDPLSVDNGLLQYSIERDETKIIFPDFKFTGTFKSNGNIMIAELIDFSDPLLFIRTLNVVLDFSLDADPHLVELK